MEDRRLAIILSIDVVGYSAMMQADTKGLLGALNDIFRDVVKPSVSANGGRVVKLLGDGALIEFQSAFKALSCAVDIQLRLRANERPYSYSSEILVRMGLHAGDVLVEDEDVFGDAVNIAARLQAEAEPGGILLSRAVADLAGTDFAHSLRREGVHRLKNISEPIETLSVDISSQRQTLDRDALAKSEQIRFCTAADGTRLAWAELGAGKPVIKAPNWVTHLEFDWRHPGLAHQIASIASKYRFVRFDQRGNGLSDWDAPNLTFDDFVADLACIFDAAKIDRAPIIGISQGCAIGVAFAVKYPDRVSALVFAGGFPVGRALRSSQKDRERAAAMQAMMSSGWDDDYPSLRDLLAEIVVPGASAEDRRQYAEDMREIISPENVARFREVIDNVDVTALLPQVKAPTLG